MLNKFILIVALFFGFQLTAADVVYVSLGRSCTAAFRLIDLNIRVEAYPFDWLISKYPSLYNALEDDFSRFFSCLSLNYDKTAAVDYYGLEFRNVWKCGGVPYNRELDLINWEEQSLQVRESFARKINRFREICNSDKTVVFIRWEDIDLARAKELRDLIKLKYPKLSFILMVVNDCEEFQCPWGEENIKNFSFAFNDLEAWRAALLDASIFD